MATFLIALFSVVLVLVCLFVTLLVLMQKPSANSGMGAALGGGAAEQAFGGEAGNVLTRGTIYAIIAFFVLSFALYLGSLSTLGGGGEEEEASITKLEGQGAATADAGGEEATAPSEPPVDSPEQPAVGGAEETGEPAADPSAGAKSAGDAAPLDLGELDRDGSKETGGS